MSERDFDHVCTGSDHNRLKRRRQKNVTCPTDEKICEVRKFLADDAPSSVGMPVGKLVQCGHGEPASRSNRDQHQPTIPAMGAKHRRVEQGNLFMSVPPGFGPISSAGNPGQPAPHMQATMFIMVPWRCPRKFFPHKSWLWGGGEESLEVASQCERERRSLEAFYPRIASIPDSPLEPPEPCQDYDDEIVQQIPLLPVDDEEMEKEDMVQHSNSAKKGGAVLHISELKEVADVLMPTNGIAHSATAKQLQVGAMRFADANIDAAAAVACMVVKAKGESNLVDEALLLELLKNPALLKSLMCSKEYTRGKSKDQDCAVASRLPSGREESFTPKLHADHGDYLDGSPVSVLAAWGDSDNVHNTHGMAPIANVITPLQHSTPPSVTSVRLPAKVAPLRPYSCNQPELHRDSVQHMAVCIPKAHNQIRDVSTFNPFASSGLRESSFMQAHMQRNDIKSSQTGSSKVSQTCRMQVEVVPSSQCSAHPMHRLTRDLVETDIEPTKFLADDDGCFSRKAGHGNISSIARGRSKRFCMYFNTQRGCRKGESCSFVH